MGLVSKTVKVKWCSSNKKYYEQLGYKYTKMYDEFEVKIEDLQKGSGVKIDYICDKCGNIFKRKYKDYLYNLREDDLTFCNKCKNNISKSFEQWCIENNRQDILDRWDYELNSCSPSEIGFGTGKKYWFKCDKHKEHKSELKNINSFTNLGESCIKCKQCKSVAQYILDNFPDKKLEEIWDYEKNGDLDPWMIKRGSHVKIWIKCQEKDYHGSYKVESNSFTTQESRCPYCSTQHGRVHPLDSLGQYIIDNYGEEFLWKVWSDKNELSPFEYCIYSDKKVWWNCPDNKHNSYKRSCDLGNKLEFRCPKCSEERDDSIVEEKTKVYLEELGYEVKTEHGCTIRPINPKTKCPLPFDNEIILENGKHLIIEVHGIQHYKIDGYYNKTNEELHQRKLYDRYKRIKCIQAGYEYLELPYWTFYKNNKYKKLIDNKIKEILDK